MSKNLRFFCSLGPRSRPEKNPDKCFQDLEKKLSLMFTRSGEIPSTRQRTIDKTKDTMKSGRGALVRGSDPPSRHSVDETTCDRWQAPARRHIWHWCAENRLQKFLTSPQCKKRPFFWCNIDLWNTPYRKRHISWTEPVPGNFIASYLRLKLTFTKYFSFYQYVNHSKTYLYSVK